MQYNQEQDMGMGHYNQAQGFQNQYQFNQQNAF